ncbi:hypothetical protein KEJ18_03200 [Candidatus Bathyarchaeota archaeon]|nr:hypothetical protein [Candidatus Bathyarchaeota archaeon]
MTRQVLDNSTQSEIQALCKEEASPFNVVAALCYDLFMCVQKENPHFNVLMILDSPRTILKYRIKPFKGGEVSFLIVDRKTFEKDVASDWLGGLLVENMLTPYDPIINKDLLWEKEVQAKKRLITEDLDNLVLEYPEISQELLIKPEYFMFEAMARKASLYPPVMYKFLKVFETGSKTENLVRMMNGFDAALKILAKEGCIKQSDGFIKIMARHIDSVRRRKRALLIFKSARNLFLRHSLEVFPKMVLSLLEDYGRYVEYFRDPESLKMIRLPELEETKKHIFISTPLGLVSLSEKISIEDFVKKAFPENRDSKVDLEKLGGALNAVYSLKIHRFGREQKIVVKVFKDWYGWKWFPLKLWAFGTRGFSVLGKSRLEREYANNLYLSKNGCNVPLIIHVSPKERLIFQEFIDGESLSNIIKKLYSSRQIEPDLIEKVKQVGGEIAKVHRLNLALGDCKPENIIVGPDGKIWFLDLEQAEKGGDQAWDLAELLFYSGHYGFLSSADFAQKVTKAFVNGYLEAGGSVENVKKARSPRYIKVFSFFTPPHILLAISSVCGKINVKLETNIK